jgi:hypothetical protein
LDRDPYWIRIGFQPKMLDPGLYEMNADPQPCLSIGTIYLLSSGTLVGRGGEFSIFRTL